MTCRQLPGWLSILRPCLAQDARLAEAARLLSSAQAGVTSEAKAVTRSASEARQGARGLNRLFASRSEAVAAQTLRTSSIRTAVEEMLADRDRRIEARSDEGPGS